MLVDYLKTCEMYWRSGGLTYVERESDKHSSSNESYVPPQSTFPRQSRGHFEKETPDPLGTEKPSR